MADPFVAEIRIFPFNFAPKGWAWCDGQLLPLSQNTALFSLIGTVYGGNGTTIFGLPFLDGHAVCGSGDGPGLLSHPMGQAFGENAVTLTPEQMASHTHTLYAWSHPDPAARTAGANWGGGLAFLDADPAARSFSAGPPDTFLNPSMVMPLGLGDVAHENRQPYLALNFCIALEGVYPSFD